MEHKILTFLMAKDCVNLENIQILLNQGINSENLWIISAVPIKTQDKTIFDVSQHNIVVDIDQKLPIGTRVGKSINRALTKFNLVDFTHFLKIDSDIKLNPGALNKLLAAKRPIAGPDSCMLIEMDTFRKVFNSKWSESPDDGDYMVLLPYALGLISRKWLPVDASYEHDPIPANRIFIDGQCCRSFGVPLWYAIYYSFKHRRFSFLRGWLHGGLEEEWFAPMTRRRMALLPNIIAKIKHEE